YRFTLDEWDELAGYVAAEANHSREKSYRKSGTNCTLGSPACWSPTPTKTVSRHDPTPSPTSTQFNAALPKAHNAFHQLRTIIGARCWRFYCFLSRLWAWPPPITGLSPKPCRPPP